MDPQAYALDLIQDALEQEETHLDLSGLDLTALPGEIGALNSLTHLSLRDNQLTELPAEIGQLANLMQLSLVGNQLQSIPLELANCEQLTNLNLKNNRLETLNDGILKLENLENLQLAGNPLPIPATVISKWNRPEEIIRYYREKFPPVVPPPPPPMLIDLLKRAFTSETLNSLAELLLVPEEILEEKDQNLFIQQFVEYHFKHGLETELRDLLQIWVPHLNWQKAIYELPEVDLGENGQKNEK